MPGGSITAGPNGATVCGAMTTAVSIYGLTSADARSNPRKTPAKTVGIGISKMPLLRMEVATVMAVEGAATNPTGGLSDQQLVARTSP